MRHISCCHWLRVEPRHDTGYENDINMTNFKFPWHAMQTYGSGGTTPPTSALGWGEQSASHSCWFTARGNSPCYPLIRRLVWPHSQSSWCAEKKNLLPPPGIEPQFFICPSNSPVTLLTMLSCLPTLMDIGAVCVMKQNDVTYFW